MLGLLTGLTVLMLIAALASTRWTSVSDSIFPLLIALACVVSLRFQWSLSAEIRGLEVSGNSG
jgi:hypothetical protein